MWQEDNEISSARRAINQTKELIESNTQDRVVQIYPVNSERQFVFITNNELKYIQVYKRNFFMSFGRIFNKKGIGESINKEMIEFAIENGVHNFLFTYQDSKVYVISVKEFKDYAIANNTIRTTSSGETTFSVPIGLLRRWV